MTSKRGQKRPKAKMTRKVQFWNSIKNIIYEDHKKPKIIHKFELKVAAMTLKFSIYIRMGLLYFWLILADDLSWSQIDVWPTIFCLNISKRVCSMTLNSNFGHFFVPIRDKLAITGTLTMNFAPCSISWMKWMDTLLNSLSK